MPDTQFGTPDPLTPPSVMTSDQILSHLDAVHQGLPDPVKTALDHAHTLAGGSPGTAMADAVKPSAPAPQPSTTSAPFVPGTVGVHAGDLSAPVNAGPESTVAPGAILPYKLGPSAPTTPPISPHQGEYNRLTAPQITGPLAHTSANTGVPGYEQISNPFLRGLATIGNAFSAAVPGLARNIPGTSARHDLLVAKQKAAVGEEQAGAKSAAEVEHEKAETGLVGSQAKEAEARAESITNPPNPKEWEEVKSGPVIDPDHPELGPQVMYVNKNDPSQRKFMGPAAAKPVEPKEPTNEVEAFLRAPENKGKPVADVMSDYWSKKADATGQEKSKPLTADTARTLNAAWNAIAPKYHLAADPFRPGMSDTEVKHVQDSMNAIVGREQGAQHITIEQGKGEASKANIPGAVENVNPKLLPHVMDSYEKISNDYQNAQSANDDIQTALSEAKKGNKLAYAYEPVLGVLTINTAAGVKRINMPEVLSYGGAGSLGDRIVGYFQKQTSGKSIPDNILKDMSEFHNALNGNAVKKYNAKIDVINRTYGSNYPHENAGSVGGETTPAKVGTRAEYDALPRGAKYIDAQGNAGTKR